MRGLVLDSLSNGGAGAGAGRHTNKLSAVVRGSMSLGSIMQRRGYKTVPSLQHPDPNGGGYFTGGFNSKLRGSRLLAAGEAGAPYVDAIQVRINKRWR